MELKLKIASDVLQVKCVLCTIEYSPPSCAIMRAGGNTNGQIRSWESCGSLQTGRLSRNGRGCNQDAPKGDARFASEKAEVRFYRPRQGIPRVSGKPREREGGLVMPLDNVSYVCEHAVGDIATVH